MEQSPYWETNWFPASQEIPPFYGTQSFIAAFTSACHLSLSSAHTSGSIQVWDSSLYFITWRFYGEELFAPHQTPKVRYYPLSAVCDFLFNLFAATLHIGGHSSICNLRTCHAMVTGTDLSWLYCILWWIYYNKWFIRCIVSMYNKHYCFLSSWYVSFLGSSGKVTYHAQHLELQILCFKSFTIVCSVKRYI